MPELLKQPIELFYAGTHTDFRRKVVTIDANQLSESVSWFNANSQTLPLVVGHPDSEDDHFGLATKLGIDNGRVVITEVDGLDRSFRKIVNSGELPRVSAKIRLQGHPSNRSSGIEFQHAGFFGKSRVALDQLKEASFSEFNELEFYFNFMDKKKPCDPEETMEEEMEGEEEETKVPAKKKKNPFVKTAEMQAHEEEVAAFQKEKAAFKRAREIEPVVEEWVREGKITPNSKSGLVAVFAALPEDLEVSFSDSEGEESIQTASEFLAEFMESLPQTIVYGEVSGMKANDKKVLTAAFSFNGEDDDDGVIDADSVDILSQLAADGVDFTDTVAFSQALKKYQGGNK
jgi:hypothetical protein